MFGKIVRSVKKNEKRKYDDNMPQSRLPVVVIVMFKYYDRDSCEQLEMRLTKR